ncbi:asparagine synthase-related protein, partial [Clostridium sp.]|uniref:asparagine synthase-related protein n=1 Tax=Clostridium sp. TaxID=1506 RepID=UPI00258EDA07
MGVIFGIYNINDIEITKEDTSNMIEELKSYSFDTLDSWQDKQIYLGCGVQYNTPESCLEKLPKYYEESGLSITADEDSPRYLIGDFAFAIWDEKKKQLFCARDQVGKRTLYYYNTNNTFAFSTTINPLLSISNKSLNERWLTDFLALDGILHAVESEETAYKNIFQLQAVNCRVRSASGVAVMLSGGLDSSAIACVAAKKLALKNEKLKAFSSVPIKEYKNNLQKCFLPDESEYIKTIGDAYDNISINYCKSEDKNSYTDIDKFIDILEQPYKIFKNLFWYNNFAEKAARGGCKVLLNGQSGNSTISYGDFTAYAKTLFESGKFITLKKEIDALSKRVKMPRREIGKIILRAVTPYKIRKVINSKITNRNYDKFSGVMIKKELLKKWKVEERFDKAGYNQLTERYYDFYEDHKFMVDQMAFSHISAVETKISLANKITIRDPSRDKRVIEFCLSVPSEQFVNNGCERLLI